ncbi:unnamed protein product [Soboliphyme baturini]|uniref:Robl_LC7 domain-containing protein n=1 Tax=Soboliphyme baturini TaxID=241478 RepID=A0A183JAC9_9BILA|nr:unnamed protein product [Soboliphyme baturini]
MADIDATLQRIMSQKGVVGLLVMDDKGRPIRSTFSEQLTSQYAPLLRQLAENCRDTMRAIEASDDVKYISIRSAKHEVMFTIDQQFTFIVLTTIYE